MIVKSQRIIAAELPFDHALKNAVSETYFAILDYYRKYPNPGACHLISSIFHVLLNEQNIDNELCIGEVKTGEQYFDHSWIEIDGKVFDIAIQLTLDGTINPPVYGSYDLGTGTQTGRVYGTQSSIGLGSMAKKVLKTPFTNYLDGYGNFKHGAWKIVKDIAKELQIKVNIDELRTKYADVTRTYKN